MNSPKIVEVWWEAEFPGLCGLITGADNGHTGAPTCADGIWSCGAFDPCSGLTMCNFQVLPAGEYWPVILIQDANGAVFDGFPCGTQNRYHTRIRAYVPNCPNLITCTGGPPWGPLEGEPDCNNSYVDTFNGGCDNTASLALPADRLRRSLLRQVGYLGQQRHAHDGYRLVFDRGHRQHPVHRLGHGRVPAGIPGLEAGCRQ